MLKCFMSAYKASVWSKVVLYTARRFSQWQYLNINHLLLCSATLLEGGIKKSLLTENFTCRCSNRHPRLTKVFPCMATC